MSDFPDLLEATNIEERTGVCLSGGGFRAMVFHLGALWRLNDAGLLPTVARFSSVSGGSITNGALAVAWKDLNFDDAGCARRFVELVAAPVLRFAQTNVDVAAVLGSIIPGQTAARRVANAYDKALFDGAMLQSLPQQPLFTFNTTNLMTTSSLRFSRDCIHDYRIGERPNPDFRLADVVAASSAFPPVLSPLELDLGAQAWHGGSYATLDGEPYTRHATLTDGGVYDNLGLESVWKSYRMIIASNAGRNVAPQTKPWHLWPLQMYRVINVIMNQVDNERERMLMALAHVGQRKVAYWTIQTDPKKFKTPTPLKLSPDDMDRSAKISTRLCKLSADDCCLLLKHAYLLSDLAIRRFVNDAIPAAAQFPEFRNLVR